MTRLAFVWVGEKRLQSQSALNFLPTRATGERLSKGPLRWCAHTAANRWRMTTQAQLKSHYLFFFPFHNPANLHGGSYPQLLITFFLYLSSMAAPHQDHNRHVADDWKEVNVQHEVYVPPSGQEPQLWLLLSEAGEGSFHHHQSQRYKACTHTHWSGMSCEVWLWPATWGGVNYVCDT